MKDLQEFERYLAHLGEGLGHADRQAGLRGYCTGLMAPLKRKSVEPMAAHLAPTATRSRPQSLHHFVADSGPTSRCCYAWRNGLCQRWTSATAAGGSSTTPDSPSRGSTRW